MTDFKASASFAERQSFRRIVEKSDLGHARIAVLKKLGSLWFYHRFVAREIRPGVEYLSKACKLSERTIRRILAEFRQLGFIVATALAQGGCGATRYVVDLAKVFEHFSGIQKRECELVELRQDNAQQPEYDADGTPVVDSRDMAPINDNSEAETTPCAEIVTTLRPANLADGIIGQYPVFRSPSVSLSVSSKSRSSSWTLAKLFGLQEVMNSYRSAKEGTLCEL